MYAWYVGASGSTPPSQILKNWIKRTKRNRILFALSRNGVAMPFYWWSLLSPTSWRVGGYIVYYKGWNLLGDSLCMMGGGGGIRVRNIGGFKPEMCGHRHTSYKSKKMNKTYEKGSLLSPTRRRVGGYIVYYRGWNLWGDSLGMLGGGGRFESEILEGPS